MRDDFYRLVVKQPMTWKVESGMWFKMYRVWLSIGES